MPRRLRRAPAPPGGGDGLRVLAIEQIQHPVVLGKPGAVGAIDQHQEAGAIGAPGHPRWSARSAASSDGRWPWCHAAASPGRGRPTARCRAPPPVPRCRTARGRVRRSPAPGRAASAGPVPAACASGGRRRCRPWRLMFEIHRDEAVQQPGAEAGRSLGPQRLRSRARSSTPAISRCAQGAGPANSRRKAAAWQASGRKRPVAHCFRSAMALVRSSRCLAPMGMGQSNSPTASPAAVAWASSAASLPKRPARWAPSAVTMEPVSVARSSTACGLKRWA